MAQGSVPKVVAICVGAAAVLALACAWPSLAQPGKGLGRGPPGLPSLPGAGAGGGGPGPGGVFSGGIGGPGGGLGGGGGPEGRGGGGPISPLSPGFGGGR